MKSLFGLHKKSLLIFLICVVYSCNDQKFQGESFLFSEKEDISYNEASFNGELSVFYPTDALFQEPRYIKDYVIYFKNQTLDLYLDVCLYKTNQTLNEFMDAYLITNNSVMSKGVFSETYYREINDLEYVCVDFVDVYVPDGKKDYSFYRVLLVGEPLVKRGLIAFKFTLQSDKEMSLAEVSGRTLEFMNKIRYNTSGYLVQKALERHSSSPPEE